MYWTGRGGGTRTKGGEYGVPLGEGRGAKWQAEPNLQDVLLVIRYTRRWIQYGIIAHAVICIVIAALEQTLK